MPYIRASLKTVNIYKHDTFIRCINYKDNLNSFNLWERQITYFLGSCSLEEETWKLIGNYDRECKEHTQGLYLVAQHEEHLTHSWSVRDSFVVEIVSNGNLEWKKKRPIK